MLNNYKDITKLWLWHTQQVESHSFCSSLLDHDWHFQLKFQTNLLVFWDVFFSNEMSRHGSLTARHLRIKNSSFAGNDNLEVASLSQEHRTGGIPQSHLIIVSKRSWEGEWPGCICFSTWLATRCQPTMAIHLIKCKLIPPPLLKPSWWWPWRPGTCGKSLLIKVFKGRWWLLECSNEDKCVVKIFMDQGHTFIKHNLHNVTNVQG